MNELVPTSIFLLVMAILATGLSGVPALLLRRGSTSGQVFACIFLIAGAATGFVGVCHQLGLPEATEFSKSWGLPFGRLRLGVDVLSSVFLFPVLIVPAVASIYGLAYWPAKRHPDSAARLQFFLGIAAAALIVIPMARDAVVLLVGWEVMSLAAFFLVTANEDDDEARRSGWVYLVAAHIAALALMAFAAVWKSATGTYSLRVAGPGAISPSMAGILFCLAGIGFGLKAGLFPLHVWLPGAHAGAPSHVSAVMSGVVIKMGVYGLVRMTSLLPSLSLGWGMAVMAIGTITGVIGVLFAVAQSDIKRMLAYSSIENMGIVAMGLGLAMIGREAGRVEWIVLGLGGALLHVCNHSLFKPLLFFCAGSVIHATGTRRMDQLGGVAKHMPATTILWLIGAVSICGLPPMNGFVGEMLIYLGMCRTLTSAGDGSLAAVAFGVPFLALIGAAAVACFVGATGTVFLGHPRSDTPKRAYESPPLMTAPMVALALACVVMAFAPPWIAPILDRAVVEWARLGEPAAPLATLAPLNAVAVLSAIVLGVGLVATFVLQAVLRRGEFRTVGTWDCGFAAPTARMQYSGSSFAQMLVDRFAAVLRPRRRMPHVEGIFPRRTKFESTVPEAVLDRIVFPSAERLARVSQSLRVVQHGRSQLYLLYIAGVVIVLLILAT